MTEIELFNALRPLYPAAEYALLPQVANATGGRATRHCDAVAMGLWPSRGLYFSGFEMKSYRGDWLREKQKPEKAEAVARFMNYWWIVAAGPFVKVDELPEPWGLMVWDEDKKALKVVKKAPFHEAVAKPDIPFIGALLRQAQCAAPPVADIAKAKAEGYESGLKAGSINSKYDLDKFKALAERVRAFEAASGIEIGKSWNNGGDIGSAVRQVLNGTVARGQASLRRVAEQVLKELAAEDKE